MSFLHMFVVLCLICTVGEDGIVALGKILCVVESTGREKHHKLLEVLFYFRRLSDRVINIPERRRLISKAKVRFGYFLITDPLASHSCETG